MSQIISQRIKQQRLAKHLTQAQVAEALFVTQQTVARWENGQHLPPITALQDLAKLLEVEPAYFFGETIVVKKQFNWMALLSNLIFNGGIFIVLSFALIPIFISIWGLTLASLVAPLAVGCKLSLIKVLLGGVY
ncbi:XRE family transcriptional regulator [Lactobacillus casei] [Lactiplantibacillus mudanjiangensis]|uniref:helix-turn-helix domain-containing protein n=2 Tax=Lactiplantibacillus mudanjiangensis TaxID=1296538 RepID=UPI001015C08B|nr:helix-turn-helix transcriptional regulator [Lactiplantibacillus mudanjiangensis]VDG19584.1 XRE family transcriptional regulator [Lactobacillus casei] [Lactiplantibacillus mudanjiangensis]VDG23413.1 XRE family transcriptional regulator [Lactobacillus casei] [Lactiplantibacillus mudanjiangensis]VDG31031.1 XRE family transcriptional regulator [Lactobacillus casei] [Lactiplantibacillus mudanjiangensis]